MCLAPGQSGGGSSGRMFRDKLLAIRRSFILKGRGEGGGVIHVDYYTRPNTKFKVFLLSLFIRLWKFFYNIEASKEPSVQIRSALTVENPRLGDNALLVNFFLF
jgi:hypothetical protein